MNALRSFLREGDVAIDIGAHTGDSTLPIALAVGVGGTVFALEPNPYVFKVLALQRHAEPVDVADRAADVRGDAEPTANSSPSTRMPGTATAAFITGSSPWKHGHFLTLRVEGRNLAEYLRQHAAAELARLRYIKIDTEGFDRAVARSLADVITTCRPDLKSEIYKHMPDAGAGAATTPTCARSATASSNAKSSSTAAKRSARAI